MVLRTLASGHPSAAQAGRATVGIMLFQTANPLLGGAVLCDDGAAGKRQQSIGKNCCVGRSCSGEGRALMITRGREPLVPHAVLPAGGYPFGVATLSGR